MLAVHWSPVSKTKSILKNGIQKSKNGLYCFPLTGHPSLDRWWIRFFNQCGVRERKKYNGFVFRIKQSDFPAYLGTWPFATTKDKFEKKIISLKQLGSQFREDILFRLGEQIAWKTRQGLEIMDPRQMNELYLRLAMQEIDSNPNSLPQRFNDLDFMSYVLDDYQIVLSHSISPDRIINVIPQGDVSGRVRRLKKKAADKDFDE